MQKVIFFILVIAFLVIGYVTVKEIRVNYFKGSPTTSVIPTLTLNEVNDKVFGGNKDTSTKTTKAQGKIIAINILPPPAKSTSSFSFKLQTDKETYNFIFQELELTNVKVIDRSGKTISYKDLKVGQNISVTQNYNPSDASYFEGEIRIIE